jgi:hypothetical protein
MIHEMQIEVKAILLNVVFEYDDEDGYVIHSAEAVNDWEKHDVPSELHIMEALEARRTG